MLESSINMLSVHGTKEHAHQLQIKVVDAIERAYLGVLSEVRAATRVLSLF